MDTEEVAPSAVTLLRDFVNTREPQTGTDLFVSPGALRDWLAGRDLIQAGGRLTAADVAVAVSLREGLRHVLLARVGHDHDSSAIEGLNVLLAERPARLEFDDSGGYRLASAHDGPLAHATGEIADAIRRSGEDGTWLRLKVCARDSCHWAFYDASRNQVRRWCSMAGCGNHVKMRRAYVARRARAAEGVAR